MNAPDNHKRKEKRKEIIKLNNLNILYYYYYYSHHFFALQTTSTLIRRETPTYSKQTSVRLKPIFSLPHLQTKPGLPQTDEQLFHQNSSSITSKPNPAIQKSTASRKPTNSTKSQFDARTKTWLLQSNVTSPRVTQESV